MEKEKRITPHQSQPRMPGGFPPPLAVATGGRRLPKGQRDRFGEAHFGCATCGPAFGGGVVVLFYAYVAVRDPASFAARVRFACDNASVTGKIRIASEGINGTCAGSVAGIDKLIEALQSDGGEPLIAVASKEMDWKKQPGCFHLFENVSVRVVPEIVPFANHTSLPVKLHDVTQHDNKDKDDSVPPVERLSPKEFHAEAAKVVSRRDVKNNDGDGDGGGDTSTPTTTHNTEQLKDDTHLTVILDVRNWYESRVGYFLGAVKAPIRRFSQLAEWIRSGCDGDGTWFKNKRVLLYCTGGVRCEKAGAFLANLDVDKRPNSIGVLLGGIAAYARDVVGSDGGGELMWSGRRVDMGLNDTLIGSPVGTTCSALIGTAGALIGSAVGTSAGKMAARKTIAGNNTAGKTAAGNTNAGKNGTNNPSNTHSLFFGRNFVFDARGSVGVTNHVVGWCDGCGASTDSVKGK